MSRSKKKVKQPVPLGLEFIHVIVGFEEQDFCIHKALITHHSPYFAAAFTSGFQETHTGVLTLRAEDPAIFSLFYNWLYYQRLGTNSKGDHVDENPDAGAEFESLMKLYIFADMVRVPALANQVIRALIALSEKINALPQLHTMTYAWKHSYEKSSLRQLILDWLMWESASCILESKGFSVLPRDMRGKLFAGMRDIIRSFDNTRPGQKMRFNPKKLWRYMVDEDELLPRGGQGNSA